MGAEGGGDRLKRAGGHAIFAELVFLDLLEADADRVSEGALAHLSGHAGGANPSTEGRFLLGCTLATPTAGASFDHFWRKS